jgi:dTDP-4-amino-4,6-dideoxygalactose transaminase
VATSNGTTALELALEAAGVGPGDEVVTTPFTFVATINAALRVGARVRFADILSDTFTLDPEALSAAITSSTKAVIPVHLYGQPAHVAEIVELCTPLDIAVIEDAAQAHGASEGGRPVGSFGTGCFSLYATKNMTTGEGGMVTTNNDDLADRLRVLRNQGMRTRYQYEAVGHNHRMTDLAAAVGIAEFGELDARTERRRSNAQILRAGLEGIEGLVLPFERKDCRHVYHQFTVRLTSDAPISRDGLADQLRAAGIDTGVYYPRPAYDYDCYRNHPNIKIEAMPVAEQVSAQVLSLPVHPFLSDGDLGHIISSVQSILKHSWRTK